MPVTAILALPSFRLSIVPVASGGGIYGGAHFYERAA
jgi:hypothetical protein